MKVEKIAFEKTNSFSDFFLNYVNENDKLKAFYNHYPTLQNFEKQIAEKQQTFTEQARQLLAERLTRQYQSITLTDAESKSIQALQNKNTFTITTGHQLNIFTGPLYFIYKVITVINACKTLKEKFPAYNFVPVYWMASEDHDYEEIKSFRLYNQKYTWHTQQQGAVGRFLLDDLKKMLSEIPGEIGVFKNAYTKANTLAEAVRLYMHQFFGNDGLLVIDGDDKALKQTLTPVIEADVIYQSTKKLVDKTNQALKAVGYEAPIEGRDINFFYLKDNIRERIETSNNQYKVLNTNIEFTEDEMRNEITQHPERFSPNVLLRPVYQEILLPNLAYCGGPAELVYWLELKEIFKHHQVTYPMLLPRCFAMVINKPTTRNIEKLQLNTEEIFLEKNYLYNHFILKNSRNEILLTQQRQAAQPIFEAIKNQALQTDQTLTRMVEAEYRKWEKSLERIEQKLLRAEKRKQKETIHQIEAIKQNLFPNGSLQERVDNFLNFYQQDNQFIEKLKTVFDPFDFRMHILYQ
ncbi:MAG: bacillithiol biosynthesis cysteine-adding enzyme BshC [Cyclobacteriaceae bacterium]|jgi:bacillithiol biosynthesis cysteine-adding enzyme BshC|nr:bacillithiol biosynthesis cysteine-adding enzyme BshC [Cyclobacteriaceae bacterium]